MIITLDAGRWATQQNAAHSLVVGSSANKCVLVLRPCLYTCFSCFYLLSVWRHKSHKRWIFRFLGEPASNWLDSKKISSFAPLVRLAERQRALLRISDEEEQNAIKTDLNHEDDDKETGDFNCLSDGRLKRQCNLSIVLREI